MKRKCIIFQSPNSPFLNAKARKPASRIWFPNSIHAQYTNMYTNSTHLSGFLPTSLGFKYTWQTHLVGKYHDTTSGTQKPSNSVWCKCHCVGSPLLQQIWQVTQVRKENSYSVRCRVWLFMHNLLPVLIPLAAASIYPPASSYWNLGPVFF